MIWNEPIKKTLIDLHQVFKNPSCTTCKTNFKVPKKDDLWIWLDNMLSSQEINLQADIH
jgi:hypothetical protein